MGGGASTKSKAAASQGPVDMQKLQGILDRFKITIAEANDLVVLQDYEIVVIADDSGSMTCSAMPPDQRKLGATCPSRWDELKETVALIVDLGSCFDKTGLDVHFLNRPAMMNVKSSTSSAFTKAFRSAPSGSTPLTETLQKVARSSGGEKPVLLFILTDGQPNGGAGAFAEEIRKLVKKESTQHTFKLQIMACTDEEGAVGYLDDIDRSFEEVDVTDDYYSEMLQVLKDAKKAKTFTKGDWCMKAMLGPVSSKFDAWDEPQNAPSHEGWGA